MLFRTPNAGSVVAVSVGLCPIVFWIDCSTGSELSMSIFYLFPIALAAWYVNRIMGIVLSLLAAMLCSYAEVLDHKTYSQPWYGMWDGLVRLSFFLIIASLIAKVRRELIRVQEQSRVDLLTGARNRRSLYEAAEQELEKVKRYHRPLSLLYVDLDNFKSVNDTLGHEAGDELLKTVVAAFEATLRRADLVARLGGDEFAVLMPETDEAQAGLVAERLRQATQAAMAARSWPVTTSIGAVTALESATIEELIQAADVVMYEAKKAGKNGFRQRSLGTANGSPGPLSA